MPKYQKSGAPKWTYAVTAIVGLGTLALGFYTGVFKGSSTLQTQGINQEANAQGGNATNEVSLPSSLGASAQPGPIRQAASASSGSATNRVGSTVKVESK